MNISHNFIRTKKAVALAILTILITSSTISTITAAEERPVQIKFNNFFSKLKVYYFVWNTDKNQESMTAKYNK